MNARAVTPAPPLRWGGNIASGSTRFACDGVTVVDLRRVPGVLSPFIVAFPTGPLELANADLWREIPHHERAQVPERSVRGVFAAIGRNAVLQPGELAAATDESGTWILRVELPAVSSWAYIDAGRLALLRLFFPTAELRFGLPPHAIDANGEPGRRETAVVGLFDAPFTNGPRDLLAGLMQVGDRVLFTIPGQRFDPVTPEFATAMLGSLETTAEG